MMPSWVCALLVSHAVSVVWSLFPHSFFTCLPSDQSFPELTKSFPACRKLPVQPRHSLPRGLLCAPPLLCTMSRSSVLSVITTYSLFCPLTHLLHKGRVCGTLFLVSQHAALCLACSKWLIKDEVNFQWSLQALERLTSMLLSIMNIIN